MTASRFKLRLRTLPENPAARIAALIMSATAALIISILSVIASALELNKETRVKLKAEL